MEKKVTDEELEQQQQQQQKHELLSATTNNTTTNTTTSSSSSASSSTSTSSSNNNATNLASASNQASAAAAAAAAASTINSNAKNEQQSTSSSSSSSSKQQTLPAQQIHPANTPRTMLFSTNKWGVDPISSIPWDVGQSSSATTTATSASSNSNPPSTQQQHQQQPPLTSAAAAAAAAVAAASRQFNEPPPMANLQKTLLNSGPIVGNGRAPGRTPSSDSSWPDWPKTTASGISDQGPTGIAAFAAAAAAAGPYLTSKSPTGSEYEPSAMGTWSPIVKGSRPGTKWDGDSRDSGDNGRLDDCLGTAIWGSKVGGGGGGLDWVTDKSAAAELNSNNDKSRYRPQQPSSSTSLLMTSTSSSNTSPSSQHSRTQQTLKQPLSHNFDQVQVQQSNALSSQVNQPNRALGLSSNVPSTQQLKHMVQQIQLAVQAGHLNPQILNQPLAPVTLQLLYQLLQQIKVLHQLQLQTQQQFNKPENLPAAVNVHITKTKQNILNLQNQIAAQQAVYLKQPQGHNISSRQPTMPSLATGGVGTGIGPALPPGISQSGDSFRSGSSISDFHGPSSAMVNNFGVDSMSANGLANSLGHMNLGAGGGLHSRFDHQQWRAPSAKQPYQSSVAASTPFGNHNLMNQVPSTIQKSMLNSGASGNGGSSFTSVGMQQGDGFDRAPGQASSIRSSTWSAFGAPTSNQPESEWPKTTSSGISGGNSTQPSNAFDLVPEFEPGKPWRGSIFTKSVEDDPTMTPGSMARSLAPQRKTIWSDEI